MKTETDGLVIVDKPAGITSHDVVSRARRIFGTRRIGHAGTLDPMATGVLVLGVNRGTRFLHYLTGADKTYEATIRLGATTTTEDADGEIVARAGATNITVADLEAGIAALTGQVMQVPSAVSAIKVGGKRSYERVRAGEDVKLSPRPVMIVSFNLLSQRADQLADGTAVIDVEVAVTCSSGTYVRALARDLGQYLRTGGHLTRLRRTRVGQYRIDQALSLQDLQTQPALLALAQAAQQLFPARNLSSAEAADLGYGKWIAHRSEDPTGTEELPVAGYSPSGVLIALLITVGEKYRPVVVFAPAS
ncbi:MAG TPA: tRNA pseudouridine(55) synthase TruB [Actinomycetales bacterium]|nr:tRNA pseudouridine(55) synthase TruB [Actinomycetales bacterium]